jgi:ATP-dependent Clp protease adaptor protein ClpS
MKTSPKKKENHINSPDFQNSLVLFNDSVNTFEYIIESLVELCHHDPYQATQCAILAHYKGKCEIKRGDKEYLLNLQKSFISRGINVCIE